MGAPAPVEGGRCLVSRLVPGWWAQLTPPASIAAADVLVYLADDTVVPLAVENLPSLSAHELHRAVREVLQLPDIALEAFALWLVSPLLGKAWQVGGLERR